MDLTQIPFEEIIKELARREVIAQIEICREDGEPITWNEAVEDEIDLTYENGYQLRDEIIRALQGMKILPMNHDLPNQA